MNEATLPLLVKIVRRPDSVCSLDTASWDLLIRQARRANFLASLDAMLRRTHHIDAVPFAARRHLDWASAAADKQRRAVHWEIRQIRLALQPLGVPVILLKGAAYVAADLPVSAGRVFCDVDILSPIERLHEVEAALMLNGWTGLGLDEYDQHYYRAWMHEIPPLRHVKRGAVIDVHHAILPLTSRLRPASFKLLASAMPVTGMPNVKVLCQVDMLLHSALHLFYDGELDNGFRDLLDLHHLFGSFGNNPQFWAALVPRAVELNLERPLFYALRFCVTLLATDVPKQTMTEANIGAPPQLLLYLMDQLYQRALMPMHQSCDDRFTRLARLLLYVRGNWLRMPPLLLARHLLRKSLTSKKTLQTT